MGVIDMTMFPEDFVVGKNMLFQGQTWTVMQISPRTNTLDDVVYISLRSDVLTGVTYGQFNLPRWELACYADYLPEETPPTEMIMASETMPSPAPMPYTPSMEEVSLGVAYAAPTGVTTTAKLSESQLNMLTIGTAVLVVAALGYHFYTKGKK
jgi:hypothetical protein